MTILEALITFKQSARNLASSAHQQTPNDGTVEQHIYEWITSSQ